VFPLLRARSGSPGCAVFADLSQPLRSHDVPRGKPRGPESGSLNRSGSDGGSGLPRSRSGSGAEFLRGDPNDPTGLKPLVRVKVLDIDAIARTARLGVTRRPDLRSEAGPATNLFGVEGDGAGLIVIGGKVVNVPPRSPLYTMVEEIAQQLQEAGVTFNAQDHDLLHRGCLRAIASLADLLPRMESPHEPRDVMQT
jgi:hypothetical protein